MEAIDRVNIKVKKVYEQTRWVVTPTNHDEAIILRLMQRMYDLGHADGYAERISEEEQESQQECWQNYSEGLK
jgi:hypothetical protein